MWSCQSKDILQNSRWTPALKLTSCHLKELSKIAGSSPHMETCTHKLVSYSDDKLSVLGTVKLPVKSNAGVEQELTFHIVETNQPGLLGLKSSQDLGLIKVVMMTRGRRKANRTNSKRETSRNRKLQEELLQKYSQVFTGLGARGNLTILKWTHSNTCHKPSQNHTSSPPRQRQSRAGGHGKARSNSEGWRTHWLGKLHGHCTEAQWKFANLFGSKAPKQSNQARTLSATHHRRYYNKNGQCQMVHQARCK